MEATKVEPKVLTPLQARIALARQTAAKGAVVDKEGKAISGKDTNEQPFGRAMCIELYCQVCTILGLALNRYNALAVQVCKDICAASGLCGKQAINASGVHELRKGNDANGNDGYWTTLRNVMQGGPATKDKWVKAYLTGENTSKRAPYAKMVKGLLIKQAAIIAQAKKSNAVTKVMTKPIIEIMPITPKVTGKVTTPVDSKVLALVADKQATKVEVKAMIAENIAMRTKEGIERYKEGQERKAALATTPITPIVVAPVATGELPSVMQH